MGRRKIKFKPINLKGISPVPAAEAEASPPWMELPLDLTANILQRLGAVEILGSAQKVCATWRKLCQDPAMWRVINIINPDRIYSGECTNICRRAVDRSHGQLIDVTLVFFGRDELLDYIVLRSRHLRCLTLAYCDEISTTALITAVKKLPQLEELHLIKQYIPAGDIQTIGISCPMLKSFTSNHGRLSRRCWKRSQRMRRRFRGYSENDEAVAIAKSMPNLHHLRLFANYLNNEGLEAILDGCPRLESLDLRQCFGLDLVGALGKRCRDQIKHLKLPSDSDDDPEWIARESFYSLSPLYRSDSCEDYYFHCDYEFHQDYTVYTGYDIDYYDDDDVVVL
ncbi:hypothetical protein C2S52_000307 [Perilla frutescens var. hirtella]|nr:hypothetical protein C2S52_000307 [Perilla frutescens var. hirtella]